MERATVLSRCLGPQMADSRARHWARATWTAKKVPCSRLATRIADVGLPVLVELALDWQDGILLTLRTLGLFEGMEESCPLTDGLSDRAEVGLPVLVGLPLGWLDGIPLTLGLSDGIDGLILGCELSWETSKRRDSLTAPTTATLTSTDQDGGHGTPGYPLGGALATWELDDVPTEGVEPD